MVSANSSLHVKRRNNVKFTSYSLRRKPLHSGRLSVYGEFLSGSVQVRLLDDCDKPDNVQMSLSADEADALANSLREAAYFARNGVRRPKDGEK